MGLQVYCGCDLVLSTGFGGGGGFLYESTASYDGGFGTGGGLQSFALGSCSPSNSSCSPLAAAGGGGGGRYTSSTGNASADVYRPPPVDEDINTIKQLIDKGILTAGICGNSLDSLLVLGGGGGGTGFTVESSTQSLNVFGGSVGVSFSAGMPGVLKSFQHKCGAGKDSPALDYKGLASGMDACRKTCLRGSLARFWECNCPCQNSVFASHGMTFAQNITCSK